MSRDTLQTFYEAFQRCDGSAMAKCYASDARFSDPAFELSGSECGAMWQMLTSRSRDLKIRFEIIQADALQGEVNWEADYTFSQTKRFVKNRIHAKFQFRDGLIVRHVDDFPFALWARQALGPIGFLLGHTRWLQNKVRAKARAGLNLFLSKKASA